MTANAKVTRQAEAAGAVIWRGPGEPLQPLQPRPASRQRDAILIVILLAAAKNLAPYVPMFVIALAAIRRLVRESQVVPDALTWYFGPAPAWVIRWRNRRYLRRQRLHARSR
jgi:hypothetical protein